MEQETALKWGLRLLGILLSVGPILGAMALSNWDIQKAVIDQEGIEGLTSSLSGLTGGENNIMGSIQTPSSINPPDENGKISFQMGLPPFPFTVTITDFSYSARVGGVSTTLVMKEENVELRPGENATITLEGTLSSIPSSFELTNVTGTMTLEKYGVTIKLNIAQSGGTP